MPIAHPGLTGQRVDALGELILLPGASFELAAEHVTIVLLFLLPHLNWLRVWGRLWGFLGWGYGITLVTIHRSSEVQVEHAERQLPNTDPGTGAERSLATSHNLPPALCAEAGVLFGSKPHSSLINSDLGTCPGTLNSYQSGMAPDKVFLGKWIFQ